MAIMQLVSTELQPGLRDPRSWTTGDASNAWRQAGRSAQKRATYDVQIRTGQPNHGVCVVQPRDDVGKLGAGLAVVGMPIHVTA